MFYRIKIKVIPYPGWTIYERLCHLLFVFYKIKFKNELILDELDFNCFLFHENSDGEGLTLLLPYLFHSNDLYEKLNLKKDTLYNFANKVQNGYLNNPYHNKIHGFDVCQVLKKILFFYNLCLRL